jgi:hypothetical protein
MARVRAVGDADRVLRTLGSEIEAWVHKLEPEDTDTEFAVELAPITGRHTSPFAVQNAFAQVLKGALAFNDTGGSEVDIYEVLSLQVNTLEDGGKTWRHSFLITPLPSKLYRGGLSIPPYQSYAFVGASTSGYEGTGPDLHRFLHRLLADSSPAVKLVEVDVDVDPLPALFSKYGPTCWFRWPDLVYPPRSDWHPPEDPTIWSQVADEE